MSDELQVASQARPYLIGAAGQRGHVTLPLAIPASPDWPGNPATMVELRWEVTPAGGLIVQPWIDGIPADVDLEHAHVRG